MHPLASKYRQIKEPKIPHDWQMFKSGQQPKYHYSVCRCGIEDNSEKEKDHAAEQSAQALNRFSQ